MKLTEHNRSIFFLKDSFTEEYIDLFINFLGLCLNQKSKSLVKSCVELFVKKDNKKTFALGNSQQRF